MINKATFALGCFWQPDQFFSKIEGISKVTVGYTGGDVQNPTYQMVCGGDTGHAEAIEIEFDDDVISYKKLLELFFKEHDPTQFNRQGPDVGSQYRSVVFYHDEDQKKQAQEVRDEYQKQLNQKIVTEIVKAEQFYPAENYHQKYLQKMGSSH